MVPVVALVGRPNVGKSTLFNRLTGSREALVAAEPGVTRDRRYHYLHNGSAEAVLVDTGGLPTVASSSLEEALIAQTEFAVDEADRVVVVLDAQVGCTVGDHELLDRLRRSGKPLIIAVNKVDGRPVAEALAEFSELGASRLHGISATRGIGVAALRDAALPQDAPDGAVARQETGAEIRLAVVGRPNAGKSTMVNRLLGQERLLVSEQPGTTRDSIDVSLRRGQRDWVLVDTAGIRRKSKVDTGSLEHDSVLQAVRSIHRAQVVVAMIDAASGAADQDAALVALARDSGRAVVVALNQCDRLDRDEQRAARAQLERHLRFAQELPVVQTSGRTGFGLGRLLQQAALLHDAAARHFPTPGINTFLKAAVESNSPPRVRGGRVRIRYGHQGGTHPLRIVLHGTRLELLPPAYLRYLAGAFRKRYRLPGVPVAFVCRDARRARP